MKNKFKKTAIFMLVLILIIPFSLILKSEFTTYDVTDEAIINASPEVVFKALRDEFIGKTNWWMPYLSSKIRDGHSPGRIGSLIDVTVHGEHPVKITSKSVEIKENEMIRSENVEGPLKGETVWTLERVNDKTKLSCRWRMKASGLVFKLLTPLAPIEKNHSAVMQAGYANLNKYLAQRSEK